MFTPKACFIISRTMNSGAHFGDLLTCHSSLMPVSLPSPGLAASDLSNEGQLLPCLNTPLNAHPPVAKVQVPRSPTRCHKLYPYPYLCPSQASSCFSVTAGGFSWVLCTRCLFLVRETQLLPNVNIAPFQGLAQRPSYSVSPLCFFKTKRSY